MGILTRPDQKHLSIRESLDVVRFRARLDVPVEREVDSDGVAYLAMVSTAFVFPALKPKMDLRHEETVLN